MSSLNDRDNPPAALLDRFRQCCAVSSDINEHLALLWGLARQCEHITEFGVRAGNSTTALLAAQPEELECYDIVRCPVVDELVGMRGRTAIYHWEHDSRKVQIEPTDFLHIDTIHAYSCLSIELRLHAPKVRKWIAMHDTGLYGVRGDDGGEGMDKAIAELVAGGEWREWARFLHNNGMTVLQRIAR